MIAEKSDRPAHAIPPKDEIPSSNSSSTSTSTSANKKPSSSSVVAAPASRAPDAATPAAAPTAPVRVPVPPSKPAARAPNCAVPRDQLLSALEVAWDAVSDMDSGGVFAAPVSSQGIYIYLYLLFVLYIMCTLCVYMKCVYMKCVYMKCGCMFT